MKKHRRHSKIRKIYVRFIRPYIAQDISKQRFKLLWFVWGYYPLLYLDNISLIDRIRILRRFLIIDWNIEHAHKPSEIAHVCRELARRHALEGEALLEAGCYNGGSSAKFSIICSVLGYQLCVYDSFEGVEQMRPDEVQDTYDFSGEYSASEESVRANINRYGEISVCSFHKGWFADTLSKTPTPYAVRVAYIDCDLAKGTKEALQGIVPALVDDGSIFSQDFHIEPVRKVLLDAKTWRSLERNVPEIAFLGDQLVSIKFSR
jgi:O-methyltransferase